MSDKVDAIGLLSADYGGSTPEQVAEAVLRYRPGRHNLLDTEHENPFNSPHQNATPNFFFQLLLAFEPGGGRVDS